MLFLINFQLYLPLALASNMFSAQPGVLPFTPNFGRFVLCLFILGFLIVASIATLFKWELWRQLFISRLNLHLGGFKRPGKVINMENDLESGQSRISFSNLSQTNLEKDFEHAPVGPNFKSGTKFNLISTLFSRNSAGSIYSPLSTIDKTHQDLDGVHDDRTMGARVLHSPSINQSPPSLLRSHSPLLWSPRRLFVNIKNICGRLRRPTPAEDKQRVEWICVNCSGSVTPEV
jgi:hypothetical protein